MITDYASLQSTVSRWAGGSSDTGFDEAVKEAISFTEGYFDSTLRVPEMVRRAVLTLDETFECVPSDFIEAYAVSIKTASDGVERALQATSPDNTVVYMTNAAKYPLVYSIIGTQMRLAPLPSPPTGLTLQMIYYGKLKPLSADNTTNTILATYPRLYLLGALVALEGYLVNAQLMTVWKQNFAEQMAAVNRASQLRDGAGAA